MVSEVPGCESANGVTQTSAMPGRLHAGTTFVLE
jgi:hypothetical protein